MTNKAISTVVEMSHEDGESKHRDGFVSGWNACRAAMLTAAPTPEPVAVGQQESRQRILDAAFWWAEQREVGPAPAKEAWRAFEQRVQAELALAALDQQAVRDAAQFLAERLASLEGDLLDDDVARQYYGHVAPALARLNSALKSTNGGAA